jgi:hypothetical protein
MWDEGLKLPTQVAGGRSTCFAAQRSRLRTESRVLPSTWTFGERATLIAFHCAEPHLRTPKPSRPRHSEINVGAGMRCRSLLPLNRVRHMLQMCCLERSAYSLCDDTAHHFLGALD